MKIKISFSSLLLILIAFTHLQAQSYGLSTILDGEYPVIDGDISDWAIADRSHDIIQVWRPETTTAEYVSWQASSSIATWRSVWDVEAVYVLVEVPDDDFYPSGESGIDSWLSDKVELYFDVIYPKVDGGGPASGADALGHYQFAPDYSDSAYNESFENIEFAYWVSEDSSNYAVEYRIPFISLTQDGANGKGHEGIEPWSPFVLEAIGFDVTIIDLDEKGKGSSSAKIQRINWYNDALESDSWTSLDKSGDVVFVDEVIITDDCFDGIYEDVLFEFSFSPNPVQNELYISGQELLKSIEIYDLLGQLLHKQPVWAEEVNLQLGDLKNGVYLLKLESEKGIATQRFIKE